MDNQNETNSFNAQHVSPPETILLLCLVVRDVKTNKSIGTTEETMVRLENSRISLCCYFIIEKEKILCVNDV